MAKTNIDIGTHYGNIYLDNNVATKTSILGEVIVEFAKVSSEIVFENEEVVLPFEIQDKISHNSVIQYEYLFENFVSNEKLIRDVYSIIHETSPFARNWVLKSINSEYKKWRGHILLEMKDDGKTEIECVRLHSDFLIEKVILNVKSKLIGIESIALINEEYFNECISIVVADAFFECKILENPN